MKNLDWNTVEMTIDFKPGFVPVMDAVPVDLGSGTNKYKIVVKQESIVDDTKWAFPKCGACIGSACMAWRWDGPAEVQRGSEKHVKTEGRFQSVFDVPKIVQDDKRPGHCGLAGGVGAFP